MAHLDHTLGEVKHRKMKRSMRRGKLRAKFTRKPKKMSRSGLHYKQRKPGREAQLKTRDYRGV